MNELMLLNTFINESTHQTNSQNRVEKQKSNSYSNILHIVALKQIECQLFLQ